MSGRPMKERPRIPVSSIRAELERILASEAFSNTERLRRFLRFTVEEALNGNGHGLKEYQIGVAVFGRKESYDTRIDPIVRVEASRLRKKLLEFYNAEGRDDPVLIELRKGSYVPAFELQRRPPSASARMRSWLQSFGDGKAAATLVSAVVAVAVVCWAAALHKENLSLREEIAAARQESFDPEYTPIWGPFLAPDANNFIVFGSPMFYSAGRSGLFLRWVCLNRPAEGPKDPDFSRVKELFGPLLVPRYDYALMGDAKAVQRLTAFFGRARASVTALPAHEASWDAIKDGNIIFLGAPRMNPLLQRLPVPQDFEWNAYNELVNHNPQPGEQEKYVTASHYDGTSYAVIGCFPGLRPGRKIILITAHSAPGTLAAVDHLTRPESIQSLTQQLGLAGLAAPTYYQVLLRVLVDNGAEVKSEYVTHHMIPASPAEADLSD